MIGGRGTGRGGGGSSSGGKVLRGDLKITTTNAYGL